MIWNFWSFFPCCLFVFLVFCILNYTGVHYWSYLGYFYNHHIKIFHICLMLYYKNILDELLDMVQFLLAMSIHLRIDELKKYKNNKEIYIKIKNIERSKISYRRNYEYILLLFQSCLNFLDNPLIKNFLNSLCSFLLNQ